MKRYPRYSETFIVHEILAHEEAGAEIEIFSLRPPNDTRFQEDIARVKAPVSYLPSDAGRTRPFWASLERAGRELPGFWEKLESASGEDSRHVSQAIELACEARRNRLDLLHAHFANEAATVARLAAMFGNLPYTATAHAKDIFHEAVGLDDLARKLHAAARVITVSDFNVRFLAENYPAMAARVHRVYNGLPLERFPYRDPGDRPPRIIAVGRLVEKKGFADLIEACGLLARGERRFSCRIIGEGPLEEELREKIRRLKLESVMTLTGPCPLSEVAAQVQSAAVFAAPCVVAADGNRDGLPSVLIEAMALGTPCVSTAVTGIPEVVQDGATGLAVPEHDPAALCSALERLLESPPLRSELSKRARALIEREFDVHQNAARLRGLFEMSVRSFPSPISRVS